MIKHVIQGHNECALASIAMLAEVSLDEVRKVACKAAGVRKWGNLWRGWTKKQRSERFILGRNAVLKRWPVPCLWNIETYTEINIESLPTSNEPVNAAIIINFPTDHSNFNFTFKGKGHIIGYNQRGSGSHSVVYEDGIIFDSAKTEPIHILAWLAFKKNKYKRLEIRKIK